MGSLLGVWFTGPVNEATNHSCIGKISGHGRSVTGTGVSAFAALQFAKALWK